MSYSYSYSYSYSTRTAVLGSQATKTESDIAAPRARAGQPSGWLRRPPSPVLALGHESVTLGDPRTLNARAVRGRRAWLAAGRAPSCVRAARVQICLRSAHAAEMGGIESSAHGLSIDVWFWGSDMHAFPSILLLKTEQRS
eukprot:COSAG01_NODE_2424_length_7722_cov_216.956448_1_plen_141_part_00